MATTYLVTGLDTGQPRLDYTGVLTGHKVGDTFTTTLDPTLEQKLIGAGILAIAPLPAAVTSAGTPDASGKVLTSTAAGSNEGAWLPGGSGGSAASPIVRKFPFAFDTPDLVAGVAVYTPAIGDVLLDAWFDIVTAWDNGPRADIGAFASTGASGLFAIGGLPIAMGPSSPEIERDGLRLGPPAGGGQWLSLAGSSAWNGQRFAPAVWIDTIPLKLVVSGDGTSGFSGSITPATQGAAVLYLVTATPA